VKTQTIRGRLLASTMIGGAALMALSAAPAYAQDEATDVDVVVVTGSRIPQPNLTTTSPVNTISSADVKLQGSTRVEDVVNNLPQTFATQGSTVSNGSTGTAAVSLRGLGTNPANGAGAQRTMVLINGRRLGAGDPSIPVPDLNFIPGAMVDRIDVVTGGASAVYGADAVAGVVNFIMKKDFEGLQIDANYGIYQHSNDDSRVQGIIAARAATNAQFRLPPDEVWEGEQKDVNIMIGASSPDGKGNVTAYMGFRHIDSILQSQYDYSACALSTTLLDCGGSSTSYPGRFIAAGGKGTSYTIKDAAGNLRNYSGATDAFNFGPYNYFQRPDERYTFGAFAHYQAHEKIDVYSELMFMDDRTIAQIAPSGIFLQTQSVNCDNPFLSADASTKLCDPTFVPDQDPATPGAQACPVDVNPAPGYQGTCNARISIGRRNIEGGGRQDDRQHSNFRVVLGARGDLSDTWAYDVYGQYNQSNLAEVYKEDFSLSRTARALQVRNVGGVPTCISVIDGTDPTCVPYNIFQLGGVTQAALDYVSTPGFQKAVVSETIVSGSMTGHLGDYGIKSPAATDGVDVALGVEYRREALDFQTDVEMQTGDLAGRGGATPSVTGAYNVMELFGEARIPLVQDADFAKDLSLNVGYRWSEYNKAGNTNTYKVEGNWSPTDDIRFRASYNRAVRAPNIIELFAPAAVGLDGTVDPCAGAAPAFTLAQCQNQGVTAGQYGGILANPAGQYNGLLGGNPNLEPEEADTYTYGFVLTPAFLPGFNLTVDYFDIKVSNVIGPIGANNIITQCGAGDAASCALIHRQPGTGSLWLDPSGFITDINVNAGELSTKGVDIQANYRLGLDAFGMEEYGSLDLNLIGTWLQDFTIPVGSAATQDCTGQYGPQCGTPRPEWRHKFRATWNTPWDVKASLTWRYIAEVTADPGHAGGPLDATLGSRNYFDLAATWRFSDTYEFRAGINNVLDKDPPLIGSGNLANGYINGNTAPQVYDALGRFIFFGVTANF
jgi:outer membrane receptor protein involved in Fe transport